MSKIANPVSTLLHAGADAMDNLYDIEIQFPFGFSKFASEVLRSSPRLGWRGINLAVRAEGFTPPKQKIETYDVTYGGNKMKKAKPSVNIDRQFSISFRLDAYYDIYRIMHTWRSMVVNASTGFASGAAWSKKYDQAELTQEVIGAVTVKALGMPVAMNADNPYRGYGVTHTQMFGASPEDTLSDGLAPMSEQIWAFSEVWVSEVGEPQFKNGAGGTMVIPVTFIFGNFVDPVQRDYGPSFDGGIER